MGLRAHTLSPILIFTLNTSTTIRVRFLLHHHQWFQLYFCLFVWCSQLRKSVHVTRVAGCMQGTECARASHVSLGFNKQLGRLRCQHGPISIFITVKQPNRWWPQHSSRSQRDSYSNSLPWWSYPPPTPIANPKSEPMSNFLSPSLGPLGFVRGGGEGERTTKNWTWTRKQVIRKEVWKFIRLTSLEWPRVKGKKLIGKCHRSIVEPKKEMNEM